MGTRLGRGRLLVVAVIAALVVVPAVLVVAQQRAVSAATILSILDGSASVARGAAEFAVASDGDIVNTGDRVQTAQGSHALVTFFDGSTLEIEPATTVQIEESSSAASGAVIIRIGQTIGRTWSSVQKLTHVDSKFELRTPTLVAAVRGTGFITEVLADGTSSVQTTDGAVQVTAQGQSVLVTAGQSSTAQPNAPPAAPVPAPRTPNRLRFGMHSPAYLVVVDPFGRSCGIVQGGPTVVRQIPGCLASAPGTDPQLVDVPNAATGTYQLVVVSIPPGGPFVATASALDGLGDLSFNYTANGSGQPGAKFTSRIDVATGPNGSLVANGLGPLIATEQAPVKVVVRVSPTPQPSASGTPDASAFPPLPGIGFAAGTNLALTPQPAVASSPTLPLVTTSPLPGVSLLPGVSTLPAISPLPTLSSPSAVSPVPAVSPPPTLVLPTPTLTVVPSFALPPIPTLAPTPIPNVAPTLTPTVPPTPTPTLQPTPTPLPPAVSGGNAAPGGTLPVLGTNWPAGAAITIRWPDGTQVASADAQADGRIATLVRVPGSAVPGQSYKITASGGGHVATADVVILYSPSLTLLATFPPLAGTSVPYAGSGWPPNSSYSISFGPTAVGGGTTSAVGTIPLNSTFVVPPNTPPGTYTVTASSGVNSATAQLTTQ